MAQGKVEICGVNTAKLPVLNEEEKEALARAEEEARAEAERLRAEEERRLSQCPECGRDLEPEAKFCMLCGAARRNSCEPGTAVALEVQVHRCPQCSSEVAKDDLFCMACGFKLK